MERSMKIALLLFGQPRYIENDIVFASYKNVILDKYKTDVFCHAWISKKGVVYETSSWSKINPLPSNSMSDEIIKSKYNPVAFEFEEPRNFSLNESVKQYAIKNHHPNSIKNDKDISNICSQIYSISRVSNLCWSSNIKYDFVILCRYDTPIGSFPDLYKLNKDKFYLSDHHNHFPDLLIMFGHKFLDWSRNIYGDMEKPEVYENLKEISPESFKYSTFKTRFGTSDMVPIKITADPIRK